MFDSKMLEELARVPWESIAQPDWNASDEVPAAIRELASCSSEPKSLNAYNRVLYAFGNNHAGTYYPVALAALPFLAKILHGDEQWARMTTLDILIDLIASFAPEPGFEMVFTPDGETKKLEALLREEIQQMSPLIQSIASADNFGKRERNLAAELLTYLDEDGDEN